MSELAKPYRVLIVEPDAKRRQTYVDDLKDKDDFTVAGVFAGKREAQQCLSRHSADFLIVNTRLMQGNAAELIRASLKLYPNILVLVATLEDDETTIMQTIAAGANGYVLVSDTEFDVASCLKLMLAGGSPVSPSIARCVLRSLQHRAQTTSTIDAESPLSPRETDIVRLMAQGMSFKEIGEILAISLYTVTTHIKKIYRKLDVHSRNEAVREARRLGLIDASSNF